MTRAELIARIRARRAFLRSAVRRKSRRGRLPRQSDTRSVELLYFAGIVRLLERARRLVREILLPALPSIIAEAPKSDALHIDARGGKRVNELLDQIVTEYWKLTGDEELNRLGERIGNTTEKFHRASLGRQIQAGLGVELDNLLGFEPNLDRQISNFVAENIALIKSIPDRYFQEIEFHTITALREGARHEELAKTIQTALDDRYDVATSRAELIARDQVGKFYSELNKARQTALGIEQYIWRTVRDSRVRPDHQDREGEIFAWDDPPEDGHPGQAIQCRCHPEPVLDDILAEL